MESAGVLAGDLIYLREEAGDIDASDTPDLPPRKKRHREEKGFGGTLLGRSSPINGDSHIDSTLTSEDDVTVRESSQGEPDTKPCKACTFDNPYHSSACEVCESTEFC